MNTGIFALQSDGNDFSLTTAATYTGDWYDGFDGVAGIVAQFRFQYGSGGTDARVYLQTSIDQGTTAIDIACLLFGTVSQTQVLNFAGEVSSGMTGSPAIGVVPTDAALTDSTVVDHILGDRFRVKIVTTGTYASSTVLSVRIAAR